MNHSLTPNYRAFATINIERDPFFRLQQDKPYIVLSLKRPGQELYFEAQDFATENEAMHFCFEYLRTAMPYAAAPVFVEFRSDELLVCI